MARRIRVLIVDDHELFRRGLAELLKLRDELVVVGELRDGQEALQKARLLHPDVILLDIQMPGSSGLEILCRLREESPECKVLMLTVSDREDDVVLALRLGAAGYIVKTISPEGLLEAIHQAARGEVALSQPLVTKIVRYMRGTSSERIQEVSRSAALTVREREVLAMLPEGVSNREIAQRLVISEHTARAHMRNILDKLGLQNRVQAAAYAASLMQNQNSFIGGARGVAVLD